MDRSDLVLQIVCSCAPNDAFYTKEEVSKLMLVSKACIDIPILKDSQDIYKAKYLLDELNYNTITLAIARDKKEKELKALKRLKRLEKKEKKILQQVLEQGTEMLRDCFTVGLMAVYKEQIYDNKTDYYFTHTDRAVLYEYERIVNANFGGEQAVYEHHHNPRHCMFQDDKNHHHQYAFYYDHESYGSSVLDDMDGIDGDEYYNEYYGL
jgi:hypothetical protein